MDIIEPKQEVILDTTEVKEEPQELPPISETKIMEENIKKLDETLPIENNCDQINDANSAEAGDEDIPTDFFDDFNNKEFLAGLDVVDAWGEDDDERTDVKKPDDKSPSIVDETKCNDFTLPDSDDTIPIHEQYANLQHAEQVKSESTSENNNIIKQKQKSTDEVKKSNFKKELPSKQKHTSSHSNHRGSHKEVEEQRRDPEKVKRDIIRDKEKCEKSRITDKLKLVETGLVPPGTEMDIPDAPKPTKKSVSPNKVKSHSREDKNDTRVPKRHLSRSPSPYRRKRRPSPLPISRRRHSPEPTIHRRRSRSPHRAVDRFEDRKFRIRSRSNSPSRKYRRSNERHSSKSGRDKEHSPEIRKRSFLEELGEKLNSKDKLSLKNIAAQLNGEGLNTNTLNNMDHRSVMHHPCNMIPHNTMAVMPQSVPQIVPPPIHNPYNPVYDQQYFVGSAEFPNYSNSSSYVQPSYNCYQQNMPYYEQTTSTEQYKENTYDADAKLFNDENISMTEYLKLSTRSYDNNIQKIDANYKVKVLSRCQDSMKLLSELSRPNGRFFNQTIKVPNVDNINKSSSEKKNESNVHFSYTTQTNIGYKTSTGLSRLLSRLALKAKLKKHNYSVEPKGDQWTQTVDTPCPECEIRKKRTTVDVGVQCDTKETASISVQVTEEDFLSTARSALKNFIKSNQSFSSLTPAQILAQLELDNDNKPQKPSDYEQRLMEERIERERRAHLMERRPLMADMDYDRRPPVERRDWSSRNYMPPGTSRGMSDPRLLPQQHVNMGPPMRMSNYTNFGGGNSYSGPQQAQGYRQPRPLLQPPSGYGSRNFRLDGNFCEDNFSFN